MTEKNNISRRRFIFGSALSFAGLVSGFISSNKALAELIITENGNNKIMSFAPSIWVEITKENEVIVTVARSELGQGVRTSFSMILADELDADWDLVRVRNAEGDSKYGNQSTGGSTSIRTFWQPLRTAGAQAKKMLITAASLIWGISEANCYAEKSFVYEKNGSRKLSYGELIDKALTLPVPPTNSVTLKKSSEFKLIGKTKWNFDEPDIVTGKAKYGSDYRVQGMKYAVILRCPYISGSLQSYDDTNAKKVKGVLGVYQMSEGIAVVAENSWAALEGRNALKAVWRQNSNFSSEDIRKAFTDKIGTLPNLPANTSKFIEGVYEVPFLAHTTMEPMSAFAHFKDGNCEVWTGTQNPQTARSNVASALGISQSNVTVNVMLSGGGFGRRHDNDYVVMAAKISKLSGYPILFFYTKEDDIKNDNFRPASMHAFKVGITSSGYPSGWIQKVISQGDVSPNNPNYDVPNITNQTASERFGIRTGPWRSVDYTQNIFVNESLIDELAHLAGKDPYQYRYDLTKDGRLKNVLKLVAEKSNWGSQLPKGWGRGIAAFVGYGAYIAHVVEVSISDTGKLKIQKVYAVVDPGFAINPGNIKNQIMGAAIDAFSTALNTEITVKNGEIQQSGFHNFRWLTMEDVPEFDIDIIHTSETPSGMGEVGFPSVTPALCNAIFDATGIRIRRLPIAHTSLVSEVEKKSQISNNVEFEAVPTPFESSFKVSIKLKRWNQPKLDVSIVDILGKKLIKTLIEFDGIRYIGEFSFPTIAAGTYYVLFSDGIDSYSFPIMKK
ncbi:MAG: molybdopterin-dependent oxidoreductase [Candidatus Kapabacteria bacterium]|nr:molybdopterin-dependent oxidoreductase [Candidatus Kapabacteria bacterium]